MHVLAQQHHVVGAREQGSQGCVERCPDVGGLGRLRRHSTCGGRVAKRVRRRDGETRLRRIERHFLHGLQELGVALFDRGSQGRVQAAPQCRQRVSFGDRLQLLRFAQIVTLAVRAHPLGIDDEQPGALLAAHLRHNAFDGRDEVSRRVVDTPCAQSKGLAATLRRAGNGAGGRRRLRNAVVLHHKQDRAPPYRGEIHALVQQTFTERAVSDHDGHHAVARTLEQIQRMPDSDASHPGLHAIAVETAMRDVLAAAVSTTNACLASHDLGHQPECVAGVGQIVAVVSMVREHGVIGVVERPHH